MHKRIEHNRTITPDAYRVLILVLWMGIAGVFIRIWGLWNYAFNPDEVMLSFVADATNFTDLWEGIKNQTNAPLMYVILHLLIMLGKNELLLRCISLVPGAGLIIVFYFLGKKVSGAVSGITMAFLCAFGYGAVQLSQVVRPYSMLLVFLSGALYFFVSCLEKPGKKYLYGYSLCMLLAIAMHYPAVMFFAAIGCVWLLRSIIEEKPSAEYRSVIMAHLPSLALFCILYFFHISYHLGGGGVYGTIKETYLAPLFPHTFPGFINNTRDFFGYLFLPPYATLFAVLSMLGVIALWKTSQRALAATIVLTFAITIVFTIFKLFPFGGSRHSIYLFPMVCLLVGASAQYGFERFLPQLTSERARTGIGWVLVLMVMLSVGAVTFKMRQCDFLRRYKGPGEFSVTRADYDRIVGYLVNKREPRSVILTNLQTYHYLAFFNSDEDRNKKTYVALGFFKFAWEGLDSYLVFVWKFDSTRIINAALQALKEHAALTKLSTIYFVNIGWETGFIDTVRSANPLYKIVFNERLLLEGGYLYSLSPQAVLREIGAGRFRNTAAATPLPDNAYTAERPVDKMPHCM
ncbi:MAG: glycosyltransferase family 39 protein [Proteobacteria bacterium]|nr:glycosyltransferase family 39 protein [Pseudomonadota bacterium]